MKKKSFLGFLAIAFMAGTMVLTTSCGEEDTEAPVITLTDGAEIAITYGDEFTDPGYTVSDNEDKEEDITVTTSGEVDEMSAGDYTITYTATDKEGNSSTKTRKVIVDAAPYVVAADGSATFSVDDTDPEVAVYNDNVTTSDTENNKIIFSFFGWFEDANVVATLSGSNTITIAEQTINCGNPNEDRKFSGSGTFTETTMTINYTVALADGTGEYSSSATYTKQ